MAIRNIKHMRRQLGQGMTEYIIITALIAIAAIGTYGLFGETLRNQVAAVTTELSGQNSDAVIQKAQDDADAAQALADQEYNLSNYDDGAAQ
ncbi:pilus assembly protein [Corallincola platygyrae]|uniref:Pilus assembly protein n=1 Tax=Corallincola platygyrae TaxID=1193278 RepID=A0ABW4XR96_9GAMM